jgi:large subunit ribosomal protein L6
VSVKGPLGDLTIELATGIDVSVDDGQVVVSRVDDTRHVRSLHGLTRSLIANMIEGVTKGYKRELLIEGVGFKAVIQGKKMMLSLGFANAKEYAIPDDVTITEESGTRVTISGMDKQRVGQAAARIRSYFPVEPYKGKGIRYSDEVVRRKVGKTVA